jgi:hypothetical protein
MATRQAHWRVGFGRLLFADRTRECRVELILGAETNLDR